MASVDRQCNLPSYLDIMQKVKLLDVIRGAPGATLANYAQPLEETTYLMSKWSSHTSTVASNPGAAQALSEKAVAVCALHLSIQPHALKGDIPTGPKAAAATSSSPSFVLALVLHLYYKLAYIKLAWGGPEEQAAEIAAGNADAKDWQDEAKQIIENTMAQYYRTHPSITTLSMAAVEDPTSAEAPALSDFDKH
ncbi:hypothetical protein BDZ97DRAFT_1920725 [Flammula alnicola]|nr:hypothetical protein BDZ97DRAFT_1920725 [Flammula alnicola]